MTGNELAELDEQFEVVVGRKAPLTMVPDWITLHEELEPQAKAVYNVLAMHVNVSRGDSECWPSRKTIAKILGYNREQSVDKYLDQLEAADAIERDNEYRRPNGAKGVLYIVHQTPPAGYKGPTSVGEYYKRRREALAAAGPARKPGRPRKTLAAAAEEKTAKPAMTATTKKTTTRKTAAKKTAEAKSKSPEEIALDERAQKGADLWWEEAKKLVEAKRMGPLMGSAKQKSGYYLNLRTRIREALDAGYDHRLVWRALHEIGEWSPSKRELDRTLRRLNGVRQQRGANGRGPLFTNDQWEQNQTDQPTPPAAPDLSVFGVQADDDAA